MQAEGGAGGDAAQEDDEAADGEAGRRHGDARSGVRRAARVDAGDDVRQGRRGARGAAVVAAGYGYVRGPGGGEMIRCQDVATASIKANNSGCMQRAPHRSQERGCRY